MRTTKTGSTTRTIDFVGRTGSTRAEKLAVMRVGLAGSEPLIDLGLWDAFQ